MSSIRLHLEKEEWEPVERMAKELHVTPEMLAYVALNRLMLHQHDEEVRADVAHTTHWRQDNLPLWAYPSREIHAYESM